VSAAPNISGPLPIGATKRPAVQRTRHLSALVVALTVLAVHAVIVFLVRGNGWDDGSITLAFSRTFAETGQIALTPVSEEVEGISSVAWFVVMAAVAKVGLNDFGALLLASQIAAAICAAASAALFYATSRRWLAGLPAGVLAVALFSSAPFLNESMNGMEMSLLTLVVLGIARMLGADHPHRFAAITALGFVGATVRFEAVGYLGFAAAAVWLLSRRKREASRLAIGAVVGFGVVAALRWMLLGTLLPNTIAAKEWEPYAVPGLRVHLDAVVEPFAPLVGALLVGALLVILGRRQLEWRVVTLGALGAVVVFAAAYFLIVFGFNVAIGQNWGYQSRMQLSALPLLVLATIAVFHTAGARWNTVRIAATAVALFVGSFAVLQTANVGYALAGPERRPAVTITPDSYRETGEAVDRIRAALGADTISFMTPDVGGSSLCCPRLRIVDLGLLANPRLAKDGYADFDAYLAEVRPDVIETHGLWSWVSGIYSSVTFVDGYVPVVSGTTWLWVRADLAERLMSRSPVPGNDSELRDRGDPIDETFLAANPHAPIYLR
jgi:hypothetical protein